MTAPDVALPIANTIENLMKKKQRVLLVDGSTTKRDLRAGVMRKCGVEVDCAADISEARSLWRADSYNLVLINMGNEFGRRDRFCAEIRDAKPPQKVAFLVGGPEYLASSPSTDDDPRDSEPVDNRLWGEVVAGLFTNACEKLPQRWGIMEACWRISALRSLKDPRNKNGAEKNQPSRWAAAILKHTPRSTPETQALPELRKEEIL